MATVGNVKIVFYEKIVLLLHPHVDVRTVIRLPSLAVAVKHEKRHARHRASDFPFQKKQFSV